MDKPVTEKKIEHPEEGMNEKTEETWHELWPKDEYRTPDERTEAAVERKLWPRDELRPEDEKSGDEVGRLLYPRDELRPPEERAGHQVERHLWTWYSES